MTPAEQILAKALLPTAASSAEIRAALEAQIRARSLFSARTTSLRYLARLREILAKIADGTLNDAAARIELQSFGRALGYTPADGFPGEGGVPPAEPGSRNDLLSPARLRLVLDTNVQMARAARQAADGSGEYALWAWPAWSLERQSDRRVPRDWWARWTAAGEAVAWVGAAKARPSPYNEPIMVALKSSPIWQAVGDGAGGFKDTLNNAFPPFAFSSGMGWRELRREEIEGLGLGENKPVNPTLDPGEREIEEALKDLGPEFVAALKQELAA